jgi:four helix bundle protein
MAGNEMLNGNHNRDKQSKTLANRLLEFAVEIVKVAQILGRSYVGRQIAGQLLRSATSAGANYEEACGAESRSDFIHKLQIVLKELKESVFWLRLSTRASLISVEKGSELLKEAEELSSIVAKSVVTAKKNMKTKY